jgi:hypothetical protein
MKRVYKGVYQTEFNGHIIHISNEAEQVEGQLIWWISSDTLNVAGNEEMWGTLYATKREAMERLPEILRCSKPY